MALARTSKCTLLREGSGPSECGPWTIHSVRLHVAGRQEEAALEAVRAFRPTPQVIGKRVRDRETGEVWDLVRFITMHFAQAETAALMPLGRVATLLAGFPWAGLCGIAVNRVDLACDHLVSVSPKEVCDRIAALKLPYSRPYRGHEDAEEPWLSIYHNGGKGKNPPLRVVHYPRLEALQHRRPGAAERAVEYVRQRVREEVRFRGPGLRNRLGGGPMTPAVVLGSLPALIAAAERRLRPVSEAGVLSVPERDPEGEGALLALAEGLP
jgi:hypothetical protein